MEVASTNSRSTGMDALFQYSGSGVQLFSGVIFYIVISRLFNTTGVGTVSLFVSIVGLFNVIFSFGLGTAAQHFTSYNIGKGNFGSVNKTIFRIISFGILLSLMGFFTLYLLSPLISLVFLHSTGNVYLVRILGIVLFGNVLFGILNGTMLGIQNFRLSAIVNMLIWFFYYIGSLLMAFFLRSIDTIILGWILGIFSGVLLYLIMIVRATKKYKGHNNAPNDTLILRYSIPILLSSMISYGASYVDRFLVSGLMNLSTLGVYTYALLIVTSVGFISVPFNNMLMPKLSELYGKGKVSEIGNYVKSSSILLSYLYVPSALGIAALSPFVLYIVGGSNYLLASTALRIIVVASALFITQNILIQAIAAIRKTRVFIFSSTCALGANVVISILLIPRIGLQGAAIGFSSVYACTFTILYYVARKEKFALINWFGILKIWISAIAMFLVVNVLEFQMGGNFLLVPVFIVIGLLLYMMFTKFFHVFDEEDKLLLLSAFPDKMKKIKFIVSMFLGN